MENTPAESQPNRPAELTEVPAVDPPQGRPAHTVATILLMALLGAAAVCGVAWTVQDDARVVFDWDFRKVAHDATPWQFPNLGKEQDGNGVSTLTLKTGPGPELVMDLDTATVRQIRATIEIVRLEDKEPVGYALEWYWASAEDVAAAGDGWPYSTERGVPFRPLDRHTPNTHTALVYRHKRWQGTIARGFIGLKIPPSETGPFVVRTFQIEFLE